MAQRTAMIKRYSKDEWEEISGYINIHITAEFAQFTLSPDKGQSVGKCIYIPTNDIADMETFEGTM